ncbi:MAG: hypothetical protein LN413_06240 [Candidatus Thermoplasmatota archaeon]|nr:hypothetical protein [Candidatus Thermoplasmatota archaeon]
MARTLFSVAAWVAIAFLNGVLIAPAPVFTELMGAYDIGSAAAGALVSALLLAGILLDLTGSFAPSFFLALAFAGAGLLLTATARVR